jgi:hypothetical protein
VDTTHWSSVGMQQNQKPWLVEFALLRLSSILLVLDIQDAMFCVLCFYYVYTVLCFMAWLIFLYVF